MAPGVPQQPQGQRALTEAVQDVVFHHKNAAPSMGKPTVTRTMLHVPVPSTLATYGPPHARRWLCHTDTYPHSQAGS